MTMQNEVANAPEEELPTSEGSESSSEWTGYVEDFDKDEELEIDSVEEKASSGEEEPAARVDDDAQVAGTSIGSTESSEVTKPSVEGVAAEAPEPVKEEPAVQAEEQSQVTAPEVPQLSAEERSSLRQQAVAELEKRYAFSEEQAAEFEDNPTKALARMAAELQLSVYEQVVRSVMQQLPQQVQYINTTQQQTRSAEEKFFSEYQELAPYKDQVTQVAQMWTQMNPNSKLGMNERAAEIAKFAKAALGIGQAAGQEATAPPAIPTAAPARGPVVDGNYGQHKPSNPWEAMAMELENDPD